jgi:ubiquinone/menaquinone biosynthesis C-methylase UbiE
MSKDLVQQQFGANAAAYATSTVHAKGASLARLVELVQPKGDWAALDIATGAGHTALAFAPHVASVIASDLTPEMLVESAKLAAAKGYTNMTTALADAEHLPFPDASFDLVMSRIAPHHFPDIPAFLRESRRVLKPGGTFALVDNVAPDENTTPGFAAGDLAAADNAYNGFEKKRDPSHGRALTTAEWVRAISDAGLKLTHTEHAAKAMDFATWCKTMKVPQDTVAELRTVLTGASGALAAFLKPTISSDTIGFTLDELIAIAKKPG